MMVVMRYTKYEFNMVHVNEDLN